MTDPIDTQQSLLTYVYNLLTADSDLKAAMGGTVRLMPVWATPDSAFPYLVHRSDIILREIFPLASFRYYIDIWSYSPNVEEILSIRKIIIEMLDELEFSTNEIANGQFHKSITDGFVPETEENIWHYALVFDIEFYRKSETEAIIGR